MTDSVFEALTDYALTLQDALRAKQRGREAQAASLVKKADAFLSTAQSVANGEHEMAAIERVVKDNQKARATFG